MSSHMIFTTSDKKPKKIGEIRMANNRESNSNLPIWILLQNVWRKMTPMSEIYRYVIVLDENNFELPTAFVTSYIQIFNIQNRFTPIYDLNSFKRNILNEVYFLDHCRKHLPQEVSLTISSYNFPTEVLNKILILFEQYISGMSFSDFVYILNQIELFIDHQNEDFYNEMTLKKIKFDRIPMGDTNFSISQHKYKLDDIILLSNYDLLKSIYDIEVYECLETFSNGDMIYYNNGSMYNLSVFGDENVYDLICKKSGNFNIYHYWFDSTDITERDELADKTESTIRTTLVANLSPLPMSFIESFLQKRMFIVVEEMLIL